jgi:hypothetical protein
MEKFLTSRVASNIAAVPNALVTAQSWSRTYTRECRRKSATNMHFQQLNRQLIYKTPPSDFFPLRPNPFPAL